MFFTIEPKASILPVQGICKDTLSIRLVSLKVAPIARAISMDDLALAMSFPILKIADIFRPIWERHCPYTMLYFNFRTINDLFFYWSLINATIFLSDLVRYFLRLDLFITWVCAILHFLFFYERIFPWVLVWLKSVTVNKIHRRGWIISIWAIWASSNSHFLIFIIFIF